MRLLPVKVLNALRHLIGIHPVEGSLNVLAD